MLGLKSSFVALLAAVTAGPVLAAREDPVVMMGLPAGKQIVEPGNGSVVHAEYSYNDRGRGDHIKASWKLDAAGIPIEYSVSGNDYMKAPVSETFSVTKGRYVWKSRAEKGELAATQPAFYVPANSPPEFTGVLARALLRAPGHKLALLPAGEAHIEEAQSVTVSSRGGAVRLRQYQITGLGFTPETVWLDDRGQTAGVLSNWLSVVMAPHQASIDMLLDAQNAALEARSRRIAQELTHVPAGDLVIRHARLFNPRDGSVTPAMSVLVRGERIVRVAPDAEVPAPGAEVIDAAGRFLMPGLWDNHQHFGDGSGMLDLASGVTSARDMANDTDKFLERVARFDAGTELGPRVFKAGIIDGTGELAGPTKMRVDTADGARQAVSWYADHGYQQIKIYSSVKPELVPVIADAAHARGLRVSGHVPAFMSAQQFIEAGADELQHLNFVFLNFLADTVKETRNMQRFIAVAEHAREFQPADTRVKEFTAFLKRHDVVLDPTMGVFESLFCGDPAAIVPGLEEVVPRFPPPIRRQLVSGALAVPKGQEAMYREAFPSMLRMLKALHDAGVTIIPGTDSLSGYTLLHELELYERAGIAPTEVLKMATLTSARVSGVESSRGTVAAGKLADMILVEGDPTQRIADLRNVVTVIKGGRVFRPAQIEAALGIAPKGGAPVSGAR